MKNKFIQYFVISSAILAMPGCEATGKAINFLTGETARQEAEAKNEAARQKIKVKEEAKQKRIDAINDLINAKVKQGKPIGEKIVQIRENILKAEVELVEAQALKKEGDLAGYTKTVSKIKNRINVLEAEKDKLTKELNIIDAEINSLQERKIQVEKDY